MTKPARLFAIVTVLAWSVCLLFGSTLALGFFVPLYTDEVGYHMQVSRTLLEDGRLVSLLPQCNAFVSKVSLVSYPAAILYHLLFSRLGLLGLRVASLLLAFAWFCAVGWAIVRRVRGRNARVRKLAAFVAMYALGVLPLTLVTARAEPILVLCLAAYLAFPLAWSKAMREGVRYRTLVTGGFILVTSVFYFSHPKALLFTPFVLLSAALTFAWRKPAWLVLAGGFVALNVATKLREAKAFSGCPSAPEVEAIIRGVNMNPARFMSEPLTFIQAGANNLQKHTMEMSEAMTLEPEIMRFLPRWPAEHIHGMVRLADSVTRVWMCVLLVGVPLLVAAVTARALRFRRARRVMALVITLLACVFLHVFLSVNWNYYHVPLVVGCLGLVAALTVRTGLLVVRSTTRHGLRRLLPVMALVLFTVASASMITTLAHIGPKLVALARSDGMLVPGQTSSVPIFGFRAERAKIRAHAASCSIRGDGAKHLVVDDATLFAFDDLHEPLHLIYVTDNNMWGGDIRGQKNVAFLRSLAVPGIITRCTYFPTALVGKARKEGDYCCVGSDALVE